MIASALLGPILGMAAQAAAPPSDRITVTGRPWAPFISPMGEPFRSRGPEDDPFARWFGQADRNRDGGVTPDEMQGDADRFFATLDGNHDGQIDSEELTAYEAEIAPEIQVNTRWMRSHGHTSEAAQAPATDTSKEHRRRAADRFDGYLPHGLQGAARYSLLNMPEPVIGADADFDRAVTLGEFRSAAQYRFQLLDAKKLGKLTLSELAALLPTRPEGRRAKRIDAPDARVGLPLPKSD